MSERIGSVARATAILCLFTLTACQHVDPSDCTHAYHGAPYNSRESLSVEIGPTQAIALVADGIAKSVSNADTAAQRQL